ncbi:hypothetical protein ACFV0T_03035 [Streptomyces sp. NPDC059582]|uniref:hypothetical protein n=1 Tax=Streptomyces sp. NPDC059582 TaxID=3346875 RepID=UPI00368E0342
MSGTEAVGALTRKNRVGLVLAGLLGLLDTTNFLSIPADDSGGDGPPSGVLFADGILGLITVVAVVYTWPTADRTGSRVVAGSRIISAITSLPALFVSGVPAWVVAAVALSVIVTVFVTALVLSRPAPTPDLSTP